MSIEEAILLDTLRCRLNFLREKHSLSKPSVSASLGIPLSKYQRFEKGDLAPSAIDLIYIADFYQVSVDYLIGRTEVENN
ncbi:helix-turn-helix transcriptional regulator [Enterococcus faecium]|nr:helix-turn-helix transcriptional regulator [Enterococcus faecium]MBC9703781.1 helix-turn-helix transcriptional regulator [Enterococcus sp.]MDQ8448931.1 helix-turn-helix transcriptional regulator [Enterococcus faecium]MDQ8542147.1 helix-turn-helix transcriptional regulator [Enterococcus faecium]MDQ8554679.1 helix-turn-helix transcriptional regulator [Enterococcus faecium]